MRLRVPGDKSLTQRALILAALGDGESRLRGLLHGGDAESTAGALRALGVHIPPLPNDGSEIRVAGVGLRGLRTPTSALDLGNSGTGTRLLLGVLAGSGLSATVTGDASLRSRPMRRVTEPLSAMGAAFEALEDPDRLPMRIKGVRPLEAIDWPSRVASAQVKSAILLAGVTGGAFSMVTEPRTSRDHTERMLRLCGVSVISHAVEAGWRVELRDPPERLRPLDFTVPGDFSSAAFLVAQAVLDSRASREVIVEGVGLNPTRTAFLGVVTRMGGRVEVDVQTGSSGPADEPVGTLRARPSPLRGVHVDGNEAPLLIDELPLVAVLGARAEGVTRIRGAAELRKKECDRIHAMVTNLRSLGVEVEEFEDGLAVTGSQGALSGRIKTYDDHRIGMSFGILGSLTSCDIEIDQPEVADVSFPGFWEVLGRLTAVSGAA